MKKCLICQKEFNNNQALSGHIKEHHISSRQYKEKFGLLNLCKKCGKEICKRGSLSGFCNKCRDRTGIKNSFYGKKQNRKTIEDTKHKLSIISKNLWQNPDYRNKVIQHTTGKHRDDVFKGKQRLNAKKQFQNKLQRDLRSQIMSRSWKNGKITTNRCSESKIEKDFFKEIEKICPYSVIKTTICINNKNVIPDLLIRNKIVIEFYGDYWHGNPNKYTANDIICNGVLAQKIWDKDKERILLLENNGYMVYIIWESDYRANKDKILQNINLMMNWDDHFLN